MQTLSWHISNFYPRPPRGGRPHLLEPMKAIVKFLSTPSARRATGLRGCRSAGLRNFYPRPPRGGRLSVFQPVAGIEKISIHALREEGDLPVRR